MGLAIFSGTSYPAAKSDIFPHESIEGDKLASAIDETIGKWIMNEFLSLHCKPLFLMLLDVGVRGSGYMPDIDYFFSEVYLLRKNDLA
jgi:hypothetical protein